MLTDAEIRDLLRQALEVVFEMTSGENDSKPAFSAGLPLTGPGAALDSYEMMLFLVQVDKTLNEKAGLDMVIDPALRGEDAPLRTMGALAAYIGEIQRRREEEKA
ncbi:MAG: hypothetical protein LBR31_01320 [Desulfovibrio sp.]|jgi:hypothetical protein|nr:hypothetical protein [Desulfovibrio sp.]